MNFRESLCTALLANSALTALIQDRLYKIRFPTGVQRPAIAYQIISAPRETAGTDPGIVYARAQLTILGNTDSQNESIRDTIAGILQNFTGNLGGATGVKVDYTEFIDERDFPVDPEVGPDGILVEWNIYYHE